MSELTHWKKLVNPDYLGAYALEPGKDLTLTIKSAGIEEITGKDGKKEMKTVVRFQESGIKPLILNRTNAKMITKLHKTPFIEQWAGKRITLYAQAGKWFGEEQEALRVRDFLPQDKTIDIAPSIKKLKECKTLAELQSAYLALPKDHSAHADVIKLKDELKTTLK